MSFAAVGGASPVLTSATASTETTAQHTKGAWVELFSALPFDTDQLLLTCNSYFDGTTGNVGLLVDLAIGSAGDEVIVTENIPLSVSGSLNIAATNSRPAITVPLALPAGVRVSIRYQSSSASVPTNAVFVAVAVARSATFPAGCARSVVAGVDTAVSGVQTLQDTAGNGSLESDGFGPWVELWAACPIPVRRLNIYPSRNHDVTLNSVNHRFQIGVGPLGQEAPVIDVRFRNNSTTNGNRHISPHGPFPLFIPIGTRIAVRHAAASTSPTGKLMAYAAHIFG